MVNFWNAASLSGAYLAPPHRVSNLICIICIIFFDIFFLLYLVARHIYGYAKVFDGDSDFDRRDNYVQNV